LHAKLIRMKLLLVILSLMTFTIQNKHSVTTAGDCPSSMQVRYANTGSMGNVTEGQEATLFLTKLGGISIDEITVYVKSNQSSGAGEFTVLADGQTIATKNGTFKQWTGFYNNTIYHPISLLQNAAQEVTELTIRLTGVANSLHIEKYEIQWTQAAPHTVTFMRGDRVYATMTETQGNGGIYLPSVPDSAEWKFRGWSETEFWHSQTMPTLYPANAQCYPDEDCTLWAVFEYSTGEQEAGYATVLTDGEYRYVNNDNKKVITGVPEEGIIGNAVLNLSDEKQVYSFRFSDSTTAYITHTQTGTPIGYSGTQMAINRAPWKVYHEGEETIFYIENKGKIYVLWPNIADASLDNLYAGLIQVYSLSSPMRLLPVIEETGEAYFTCHPEVPMGVEEVKDERTNELTGERVLMHLGTYQLKIKNGKKIIEL